MLNLLLKGGRVVDPQVELDQVADVLIKDGLIAEVGVDLDTAGCEVLDCTGRVVVPGLVDLHVHLREPGREDLETIRTGARAAARGGFSAVCAMPNTVSPIDSGAKVRFIVERAAADAIVRVHPIGACTTGQKGESLAEIGDMLAEGAVAFSDDGRGVQSAGMTRRVMDYAKAFETTIISHCEDESLAASGVVNEGAVSTSMGLAGQPAIAEEVIVARDIMLAELTGCRLHLAHLSSAGSAELVRQAKARGIRVSAEVTPHHLFLDENAFAGRYDTYLKMNPPLRTANDREALVAALLDGTIDCVATDHAPHGLHEKEREFELAPFGITGLETAVPLVVTNLVATEKMSWSQFARALAIAPRAALGLVEVKMASGSDADITIIDPEAEVKVEADRFESKAVNSPFVGLTLKGRATEVIVGGRFALRSGEVVSL